MANALLNGSVITIVNALSGVAIAAAGSSNPVDLSAYEGGMVILSVGSAPTGTGLLVSVLRSATSNGTFNGFGASLPGQNSNNKTVTRSFAINTSAVWHRVFYDNSNSGSTISNVEIIAHNPRYEPVTTQESNVTVYSDILRG